MVPPFEKPPSRMLHPYAVAGWLFDRPEKRFRIRGDDSGGRLEQNLRIRSGGGPQQRSAGRVSFGPLPQRAKALDRRVIDLPVACPLGSFNYGFHRRDTFRVADLRKSL